MTDHERHPRALVMHVYELGSVVEVWRDGLGWWAKTARGCSQRGYPTPEHALAALTGSWPHETWLARVGDAARRRARAGGTARHGGNVVALRDTSWPPKATVQRRADQAALAGAVIQLRSRRRAGDDRAS